MAGRRRVTTVLVFCASHIALPRPVRPLVNAEASDDTRLETDVRATHCCVAILVLVSASAGQSAQAPVPHAIPIRWSASRHLTWADYRGVPDNSSDAAAMTVYLIAYEEECAGDRYSFTVTTTFQPDRSWVRPSVLETPWRGAQLLDHEQLHFDLSELNARRLRQWLSELAAPCRMASDERNASITKRIRADANDQHRYDQETNFGRDDRAQSRWSADTARALTKLAAWAEK